ncbi:FAD binding domain protein [Podospora fimiseda]|uniref:FAD binding domain protein n=1 Tax=Podospora fimiseda TaxID=252190 RepID=A0AAN7C018_9PEZI|nr:FAD binding domain protein [Podospora fimiseda]
MASTSPTAIHIRNTTPPPLFHSLIWSRVFNARQDHKVLPFAYTQPSTVSDIITAVEFAKSHSIRISIRSGGHSWAAWSVRHDAVLIDLVDLDKSLPGGRIQYDPSTQIVSCPPSITGEELNNFLAERGRFFPGGHCPDVGLGGFLLQGGMGWNCKSWRWAAEYLDSLDVVTASGQHLQKISSTFHQVLFWAARGSGPGFPAIVTRFHLKTLPLPTLYQSLYFFPITSFKQVLQWLIHISPTIPETEIVLVTSHFAFNPTTPTILANFLTFSSSTKPLSTVHSSLPQSLTPLPQSKLSFPTTLKDQYAAQRLANPPFHHYRSDNIYLPNDLDSIPCLLEPIFTFLPTPKSSALWFSLSPTSQKGFSSDDMALSLQTDHYVALYAVWEEEKDDEKCEEWIRKLGGIQNEGSYLGDADFSFREYGVDGWRFWGEGVRERLEVVRKKWDGEGRVCGFLDNDELGLDGDEE